MLIKLVYNFLIVGLLSFGGAYSAIPITREIIEREGFITLEEFSDMVAVAESTPGSFIANLATYVGSVNAGLLGAILTTIASVLPAFLIMILFSFYSKNIMESKKVKITFSVIRPAIISLILLVGVEILLSNFDIINKFNTDDFITIKKLAILFFILLASFIYKKVLKKNLSSIYIIILSALLGILIL